MAAAAVMASIAGTLIAEPRSLQERLLDRMYRDPHELSEGLRPDILLALIQADAIFADVFRRVPGSKAQVAAEQREYNQAGDMLAELDEILREERARLNKL